MTALDFTGKHISADPYRGSIIRKFKAASAVAIGKLVYQDDNQKVAYAQQDGTEAQSRAIGVVVAGANQYGETTIAANDWCSVCIFGPTFGWTGLTEGTKGWVSATAGEIDDTKPTGGYQYAAGHCIEDDVFFVWPGMGEPVSA